MNVQLKHFRNKTLNVSENVGKEQITLYKCQINIRLLVQNFERTLLERYEKY